MRSRQESILWAVVLPSVTALASAIIAVVALIDTRYTSAAVLAIYATVTPAVALRDYRALRAG